MQILRLIFFFKFDSRIILVNMIASLKRLMASIKLNVIQKLYKF